MSNAATTPAPESFLVEVASNRLGSIGAEIGDRFRVEKRRPRRGDLVYVQFEGDGQRLGKFMPDRHGQWVEIEGERRPTRKVATDREIAGVIVEFIPRDGQPRRVQ